ncbi:hypothetical protein ACFPRL_11310 [Pseudoclavibacter helvolus]
MRGPGCSRRSCSSACRALRSGRRRPPPTCGSHRCGRHASSARSPLTGRPSSRPHQGCGSSSSTAPTSWLGLAASGARASASRGTSRLHPQPDRPHR